MPGYGHSDRPLERLTDDRLGLAPYARGLAEFIRHCDTPFTVAVQGDWGTGKTSLMRMVEDSFRSSPDAAKIETLRFETWQYSQFGATSALPVSLLATLLQRLSGDPTAVEQGKRVLGNLLKPMANAALRMGTAGALELQDLEGLAARQAVDGAQNANDLKKEIAGVIERKLASGKERIVVFIDDLDRIKPEIAVEILETIKLFLDWPGCIFVLALDYGVVSRGLAGKFGVTEKELGRSFFDKIIQLPFTVPVARFTIDTYIDGLFHDMKLPMGKGDGELFAKLVDYSVSVNPRGIKRVFNSLQLLISMADARQDRLVIRILFAILCLQISYEDVYNWLLDKGDDLSEEHLLALSHPDASEHDVDLGAAVAKLEPERRADYDEFSLYFLHCLQDPDGSNDDIDETELKRIRDTLRLSRVTSVQVKTVAVPGEDNNREFRWRHRQMIGKLKADLERDLAVDIEQTGKNFWTKGSHSNSAQTLRRNPSPKVDFSIALYLGEREIKMWVEGSARTIEQFGAAFRTALTPVGNIYDESAYVITFYRQSLAPDMSVSEREESLLGPVREVYLKAHQALKQAFWS